MTFAFYRKAAAPIVVAAAWGSAFVWTKQGVGLLDPVNLVIVRMAVAALGFLVLYGLGAIGFHHIAPADLPRFGLLVLLGVLAYHVSLAVGESKLPASVAIVIDQATPLFTLALASTRSRRWPTAYAAAGMGVAASGALVAIGSGTVVSGPVPAVSCLITPPLPRPPNSWTCRARSWSS
jgi:drug/metabolite transporter (DMT)-like permease